MATGNILKNMVLLWENPNPSVDFAAQTVPIANITDYKFLLIVPVKTAAPTIIPTDCTEAYAMLEPAWKGIPHYRSAEIVQGGLDFTISYVNSGQSQNGQYCKPYRIYGIRA